MADTLSVEQFHRIILKENAIEVSNQTHSVTTAPTLKEVSTVTVLTAVTNQVVNMGSIVTGKTLYITTDQAITVSLDVNTKHWNINKDGFVALDGSYTAVFISSNSSSTATVKIWMYG